MWRRRITYILLIISAAILYLFSNETVTLALLALLPLTAAVSFGLLKISGRGLTVRLEKDVQPQDEKPDSVHRFELLLENRDLMPIADIRIEAVCTNLRTRETETVHIKEQLGPKGRKRLKLENYPGHAGRYEIAVSSLKLFDCLGLWSREIYIPDRQYLTVLPEIADVTPNLTSSAAAMLEGDSYSQSRTGTDPGEIRSIREYVPGDPVKNIHWKLSEKTDRMLVKELGLPVTDQFLLIMDTAPDIGLDPEALDAVASVAISLLTAFRKYGMEFSAGWTDASTGKPVIQKISDDGDFEHAVDEMLSVSSTAPGAFEKIDRNVSESRFAHLMLVSSRIPEGIESITNGCQVTVLLYGDGGSSTRGGLSVIGFNESNFRSELAGIEV